jgi:hypothetical protein
MAWGGRPVIHGSTVDRIERGEMLEEAPEGPVSSVGQDVANCALQSADVVV